MASRLLELRTALLEGRFEDAWDSSLRVDDWLAVAKQGERGNLDALTAVSMSAELLDYRGEYLEAKERLQAVAPTAQRHLRALVDAKKMPPRSINERRLLKRWAWVVMQDGMAKYRSGQFDRAMQLFRLCESAVVNGIQAVPDYCCFGTLSRISYGIGLVFREQFEYASAKESFLRSMEFAWQSLQQKLLSSTETNFHQSHWTDFGNARSLALGLGLVYHSQGQPDLALPVLLSAKNLLARLNDEKRISTYVDLIYYDARRSAYGENPVIVDDSIEGLKRCREVFIKLDHRLYCARANYSLALAYSQRARQDETKPLTLKGEQDLSQAECFAKELGEYGKDTSDCRAELYSTLCMSRIERKRDRLLEAETLATETIKNGGYAHAHIHVGALIARAEAAMRLNKTKSALADFEEATDMSGSNLRTKAICLLRMAEIHAKSENSKLAAQCYEEWKEIRPHISNAYIRRLDRTAQAAMESASSDLVVRMSDDHLDRNHLERRLHEFMLQWAYNRAKSDQKAADLLGISRQTLLNWKSGLRKPR